jgi:hypothetical protein
MNRHPSGKWRYYDGMLYLLSFLHVSGIFASGKRFPELNLLAIRWFTFQFTVYVMADGHKLFATAVHDSATT